MPAKCYAYDIAIDVSPNVLNIQSASTVVTVHTNIKYSLVVGPSVSINGVAIDCYKADDRGYFVAKFESGTIKALASDASFMNANNELSLTLTGETTNGDAFSGTDYILVIDNVPDGVGKK